MKDEKPRIVICVKGGLVADVLSTVPGIDVEVMDWDVFDVTSDEERRDYLNPDRLNLLTLASRDAVEKGEYGDLKIDLTKYPHALF